MAKLFEEEKLLIATSNPGKQKEMKEYLKDIEVNLLFLSDFEQKVKEPVEDSDTFFGNALIKAKYYHDIFGYPTLADDSGLCIDALNGLPGVYSARWGKPSHAIEKINAELKENAIKEEMPKAKFVCALVLYWNNNYHEEYYGEVNGALDMEAKGDKGFGYDPIFIPKGHHLTFAQMDSKEKQNLSHRGKAFENLINSSFYKRRKNAY